MPTISTNVSNIGALSPKSVKQAVAQELGSNNQSESSSSASPSCEDVFEADTAALTNPLDASRPLADDRGLLHLCCVRDVNFLQAYQTSNRPYYFLGRSGHYARALSGRLPFAHLYRNYPPQMHGLNQELQAPDDFRVCYLDPTLRRVVRLNPPSMYLNNSGHRAALSCLLRVGPRSSQNPSDAELVSLSIAAACYQAGFLVRRDANTAADFKASIPAHSDERALTLAQKFTKKHEIWELDDYLSCALHFFDDRPQPSAAAPSSWAHPRQWPSMLLAVAAWVFSETYDDEDV